MKILCCNNTKNLAKKISLKIGLSPISRKISRFSDGELSIKIYDDLHQEEVLITHQLFPSVNENLVQLLFLINAVKQRGARKVHTVIPYFAYSRMDHKVEDTDFVSVACIASLLETTGLDTLITIDLHSTSVEKFFKIPVKNIPMLELFKDKLSEMQNEESIVVSPDIGGKVRGASISKFLKIPLTILHKQRDEHNVISMSGIIGTARNKHCILVDDIIDSGQTTVTAIDTLKSAEAQKVEIIITHNLLGIHDVKRFNNIASKVTKLTTSSSIQIDNKHLYSPNVNIVDISTSIINCINLYF